MPKVDKSRMQETGEERTKDKGKTRHNKFHKRDKQDNAMNSMNSINTISIKRRALR